MSKSPEEVLSEFWGYDSFRPGQLAIIDDVLAGRDTLALMPTGGGKSICFQVPAIILPGVTIVVSPLIALMKDQVRQLTSRNIKALCISSEYSKKEVDALFDRCIYEDIKFLYLSPERLQTELARVRISKMKVSLIAVDESHCISEWGYDFRPSYLQISSIREIHPKAPVIALTASATPPVVKDIQEKLRFKKANVHFKSFARSNLSYFVDWDEDKLSKIERTAKKQGGSGIIYMRSRKGTERITRALRKRGLSIEYYHAGLESEERTKRQDAWISGHSQIIVATNAFGMGIDKPNVRFVIHLDLPDTLENYYQECGRAGRDGAKAFAVALLTNKDVDQFRDKLEQSFPEKKDIVRVYTAIGNTLQLAIGSGAEESFPLDISLISSRYDLKASLISRSISFLEREGLFRLDEYGGRQSVLKIICTNEELYQFKIQNEWIEPLINALLRSYGRLFDEETRVNEWTLSKRLKWPIDRVKKGLLHLDESGIVRYQPATHLPMLTYLKERLDPKNIRISDEHYKLRRHVVIEKAEAMVHYITSNHKCRSRMLLEYFGETDAKDCGICDYCVAQK